MLGNKKHRTVTLWREGKQMRQALQSPLLPSQGTFWAWTQGKGIEAQQWQYCEWRKHRLEFGNLRKLEFVGTESWTGGSYVEKELQNLPGFLLSLLLILWVRKGLSSVRPSKQRLVSFKMNNSQSSHKSGRYLSFNRPEWRVITEHTQRPHFSHGVKLALE